MRAAIVLKLITIINCGNQSTKQIFTNTEMKSMEKMSTKEIRALIEKEIMSLSNAVKLNKYDYQIGEDLIIKTKMNFQILKKGDIQSICFLKDVDSNYLKGKIYIWTKL